MKTIVVLGFLLVQTLLNYLLIIVISIFFNPFLLSLLKKYNGIFSILIFAAIFFLINVLILLFFRKIWPFVRKNFKNIFLTNLSILFVFILIELLLRQVRIVDTTNEQNGLHSYLSPYEPVNIQKGHIYSHKENSTLTYKTNEFSYIHKMNKDGFRCTDFDTSKGKNEIRIAAIGDSYTEGVGAPQDSTWPGLLEEKLNKTDNGFKYSVINAGIIGSDPIFGFVLLRDKLLKYHPDIVIYTINLSDYLDLRTRGGMERFKPDGIIEYKKGPVWEWLFAISFSTRLVFQGLLHYDNLLQSPADKAATSRKAYRDLLRCSKDFELLGKKYHFITIP